MERGSRIAILAENRAEYLELAWGRTAVGALLRGSERALTPAEARSTSSATAERAWSSRRTLWGN
ncbi:hypothetical protein [Streptomyces sp. KL116D]|uniref:hypothetical protein n=1 Tax=Streptomyces sp. KL116D TaxID=3045152 RepID=UPI003557D5B9